MIYFERLVVCDTGDGSDNPFLDMFKKREKYTPQTQFETGDVLLLQGGVDVDPRMYRETPNLYTQNPNRRRDWEESRAFYRAKEARIPMIGICRGAQLITVLNGGRLVQHISNHNRGPHAVTTYKDEHFEVTSAHHQMMFPWEIPDFLMIAYTPGLSFEYKGEASENGRFVKDVGFPSAAMNHKGFVKEPEIVYYPSIKALAIQGHPEYVKQSHVFPMYCRKLVVELLASS